MLGNFISYPVKEIFLNSREFISTDQNTSFLPNPELETLSIVSKNPHVIL